MLLLLLIYTAEAYAQIPPADATKPPAAFRELSDLALNTELQLVGGKTLKLSNYSDKVIVLSLFATWCGPCRFESPDLAKLYKEFESRGLVVIELSTEDPKASKKSVRKWVKEYQLPYPVGWVRQELALELMQGRTSIPQSFVIARDGRIVKRFIGYNAKMTPGTMREAVEEALR
jgi:peroxiredoxin